MDMNFLGKVRQTMDRLWGGNQMRSPLASGGGEGMSPQSVRNMGQGIGSNEGMTLDSIRNRGSEAGMMGGKRTVIPQNIQPNLVRPAVPQPMMQQQQMNPLQQIMMWLMNR